ncbi:MAG: hypothetical protein Q9161_009422 [Pseudevernia consocians]
MAENFLAQLPRVTKEELYGANTCMICHEEYGTPPSDGEPVEEPVRLPCPGGHIVGFSCISSWLSADKNRNSCPYCRYEFDILQDQAPQRLIEHEQRLNRWLGQWNEFRQTLVDARGTPQLLLQWEGWFVQWFTAATCVNEEGIAHARTARNGLFMRTGWSEMPADTRAVLWSETDSRTEFEPLASALQTRDFREYYFHLIYRPRNGCSSGLLNGPMLRLTRVQKGRYFRRLCRIGAFREVLQEVGSRNERWKILRSQGYVFDEERWVWSAYPF